MSKRDIFGNKDSFGTESDSDRKEYKPPEERDIVLELFNRFILLKDGDRELWKKEEFESEVQNLESLIRSSGNKLKPQPLIDSLTAMLRDEPGWGYEHTKGEYLTVAIQALYNLDHNEFTIDFRNWPKRYINGLYLKSMYCVGRSLEGKPNRPLILNLYGNIDWAAYEAKHCNFVIHDNVGGGGYNAENCTFSLLPDAKIKYYEGDPARGNILQRMNENGVWERIG